MSQYATPTAEPESLPPEIAERAPDDAAGGPSETGKVLVVDDTQGIQDMLNLGLPTQGFEVINALSGPEGLAKFVELRPDVAVVDVLMPGMDGYEVCRRLREISDVPIIMLSALRNEEEIIRGLDAGADDYVTKPFSISELSARMRAQLRRHRRADSPQRHLSFDGGRLAIDLDRRTVTRDGEEVHLSPTEFRLLAYLAANVNRVVPHREVVGHLWAAEGERLGPYLKIYIRRLRQKIEPDPAEPRYIHSRHGTGYVFQGETAS